MRRPSFSGPFVDAVAAIASLGALVGPIARAGVWDPYELDNAELARRVAVHAFHARSLALPGDPSTIPTLTDLGMGELPFTSMALSFRLFGWHDWSGRLPLALWAFVGAMSLYAMIARLVDRRAAVYALLALLTMPLFFLQARTMVGDVVELAAFSMGLSGFTLALADGSSRVRWAGVALGALGLVAGYLSRGLLFGVAAPALAVGLAGLGASRVPAGVGARSFSPSRNLLAWALSALGVGAAIHFLVAMLALVGLVEPLHRVIGMQLFDPAPHDSTFDRPVRQIGHALFPWSAFLPFALGRLFRAPVEAEPDAHARESIARLALLSGAGVAFAANATVTPYAGALPYIGVAALAGAVGVSIRDVERGAALSRVVAIGTALLGVVLYVDLTREPARNLASFTAEGLSFPASFAATSENELLFVTALFVLAIGVTGFFEERPVVLPAVDRTSYQRASAWAKQTYVAVRGHASTVADVWNGNLVFVLVLLEAALIGLAAMMFIGSLAGWASVSRMPRNWVSFGLTSWWKLPLAIALAIVAVPLVRDGYAALLAKLRLRRATGLALLAALAGGVLSFAYYPSAFAQLSPKEVFETFTEQHRGGDELGVLGMSPRAASFYFPGKVKAFEESSDAFPWLVGDVGPATNDRRWLVVRARDLAKMNALFRAREKVNLPVLDARSSQVLLVSDRLGDKPNENPFEATLSSEMPRVQHPVKARFAKDLEIVGWDLLDDAGRMVDAVVAGKPYTLRTHYRVLRPVAGNWQAFIHIDGQGRRHNADHAVMDGRYPMNLWQPGDYVRDDAEVSLEPNFLPGDYALYLGFFNSSTRMKVTEGDANEDRVVAGSLRVR